MTPTKHPLWLPFWAIPLLARTSKLGRYHPLPSDCPAAVSTWLLQLVDFWCRSLGCGIGSHQHGT